MYYVEELSKPTKKEAPLEQTNEASVKLICEEI
jgi:hypothetical protein